MDQKTNEYALIFKALGDVTRLKILTLLTNGEICACKILEAFHFTQPTLSYHMKLLTDSGLVISTKDGKWVYYRINGQKVAVLKEFLIKIEQIKSSTKCCQLGEQ